MNPNAERIDVSGGFYTVSEAARLLGMDGARRINRWLAPTAQGKDPVVMRDYQKVGKQQELSFLDLVEIRFVEHFRGRHISLQSLRVAARNAREALGVDHPFATGSVKFQTDRKAVFLQTAHETGDPYLLNLMTKQVEMYDIIEGLFERDLEFNLSGIAKLWRPAPSISPNVIVSPVYAFGRPTVSDRHLPTSALFEFWRANGSSSEMTADWYGVTEQDVDEAIRFELRPLH